MMIIELYLQVIYCIYKYLSKMTRTVDQKHYQVCVAKYKFKCVCVTMCPLVMSPLACDL